MEIKKNQFISIIGETGSGKSTIVNLLLKLYKIDNGKIAIDALDLNQIQIENIREKINIISQDGFIFNDTLKNNIDLTKKLTDLEALELCHKIELTELLKKLSNNINSVISENGENISGGERQKIRLIRCLAKKSNVLILDEATSAIDLHTEKKIIDYLLEWKNRSKDNFIIAISHRPSFTQHSDMIYVLENGRIVEAGSHDNLLKLEKKYYSFYSKRHYANI